MRMTAVLLLLCMFGCTSVQHEPREELSDVYDRLVIGRVAPIGGCLVSADVAIVAEDGLLHLSTRGGGRGVTVSEPNDAGAIVIAARSATIYVDAEGTPRMQLNGVQVIEGLMKGSSVARLDMILVSR